MTDKNQSNGKMPFLIDNRDGRTFQRVFERLENEQIEELQIAVGYFHVSGFNLIKKHLDNVQKISLIIGNETDSATVDQLNKGHREIISEKIAGDLDAISDDEDVKTLNELYEYIQSGRVDVRVYVKTKFHAKAYIFKNKGPYTNTAVVGSSNLSLRGLGNSEDSNTELNLTEGNSLGVAEVEKWFDGIWKDSEPYRDELMEIINGSAPRIRETEDQEFVSPKDLFKTIVCEHDDFHMPAKDILTDYQQAGVITALNAIDRYGGCMISDSVGLGKTFIGIRLAEFAQKRGSNVLILVPKSLESNWKKEIERHFENVITAKPQLEIMSITKFGNLDLVDEKDKMDLDRIKNTYDFIIIDEAHRFRNSGEFKHDDQEYSGTKRHANLLYLKKTSTEYAMLTATPINNSVMDLCRLISVFTDNTRLQNQYPEMTLDDFKNYHSLTKSITDLNNELKSRESKSADDEIPEERETKESKMTDAQILAEIARKKDERGEKLKKISALINEIMVLRTRQNIVKDYSNTTIGGMPIVTEIPIVVKTDYKPGDDYARLYQDVQDLIVSLKIPHIATIRYSGLAINLSGLFRVLLFKRLESSIHAFTVSINLLMEKEKRFKSKVEKHGLGETILKSDDDHLMDDVELDDYIDELEKPKNVDLDGLSDESAIDDANHDIQKIKDFKAKYSGSVFLGNEMYSDPKLEKIQEIIREMTRKKVLIFTQYADTAEYLYRNLSAFASDNGLVLDCVMGDPKRTLGNRAISTDVKIERFAPSANKVMVEPKDEIDILITTDKLSEGVNLQDCSVIINYDLPWNPMRMVQRVGRVDRIGSTVRTTVYNIIPNEELEAFLSLLQKLESKIHNITSIIGKESYILSEDEELDPKTIGIRFKDARMKEEYDYYERASSGDLSLETNDAESQMVLLLRKKMASVGMACTGGPEKIENPYSIIQGYEQYSFVVFRVYDAQTNRKRKNVIMIRESGKYRIIEADDAKIVRLLNIPSGISRQKALPYDFEQDIRKIIEHFENTELDEMRKKTSLIIKPDSKVQSEATQAAVLGKLRQITSAIQTTLTGNMTNDDIQIANKCMKKLSDNKLNPSDMARLKKWYGEGDINKDLRKIGYKEFVKKTDEFIDKYMKDRYTQPISKNDIQYSIVCRGASI